MLMYMDLIYGVCWVECLIELSSVKAKNWETAQIKTLIYINQYLIAKL